MKISIIGDLHISPEKLSDFSETWARTLNKVNDLGTELLILLGDIFHKPNVLLGIGGDQKGSRRESLGNIFEAIVKPLREFNGETHIIRGNHDIPRPGEEDALKILEYAISQLKVYRQPEIFRRMNAGSSLNEKVEIIAFPWLRISDLVTEGRIEERQIKFQLEMGKLIDNLAKQRSFNRFTILAGHIEVVGCQPNSDIIMLDTPGQIRLEDLQKLNPDFIALGHIHKRDLNMGYIGALRQINYGEQGNPGGFEFLETSEGKLLKNEYIHIESPRYWTFTSKEQYCGQEAEFKCDDYIRIKTKEPILMQLPPRVEVIQEVAVEQFCRRSDISPTETTPKILEEYHRLNPEQAEGLDFQKEIMPYFLKERIEMVDILRDESQSNGSLDFIQKIYLENIGRHKDLVVDFTEKPFSVITGNNGMGKTFIIEAIIGCFYGYFPTYPGSIYEQVTQDWQGEAEITIYFKASGENYKATRMIQREGKTQKQEAFLSYSATGEQLTSGKVKEFEAMIEEIVGSKKDFLASVYLAQDNSGDITDLDDAQRKEFFQKMLGLDRFQGYFDGFNAKSDELKRRIDSLEVLLRGTVIDESEEGTLNKEIQTLQEETVSAGEMKKAYSEEIAKLQKELAEARIKVGDKAELEARIRTLETKISAKRQEQDSLHRKIRGYEMDLSMEKQAREKKQRSETLRVQVEELQTKKETYTFALNEKNSLLQEAKNQQERAETFRKNLATEERGHDVRLDLLKRSLQKELKSLDEPIAMWQAKAEMLPKSGCKGELECIFLMDAKKAGSKIEELNLKKKVLQEALFSGSYQTEENEHFELSKDGIQRGITYSEEKARSAKAKADAIILGDFDDAGLQRAKNELSLIGTDFEATIQRAILAKTNLPEAQNASTVCEKDIQDLTAEKAKVEKTLADTDFSLISRLTSECANIANKIDEIGGDLQNYSYFIGEKKALLQEIDKKRKFRAEKETELMAVSHEGQIAKFLRQAFSRDGIPQLLIESAIPHIQGIIAELTDGLDVNFALSFGTQKELKSGKMRESLPILFTDIHGTRDAKRCSGGERQLVRMLVRWAVGIFNAGQSGSRHKVFIADEPFRNLDGENSHRLLQILLANWQRFNQVILVSHEDEIISGIPTRFELTEAGIREY